MPTRKIAKPKPAPQRSHDTKALVGGYVIIPWSGLSDCTCLVQAKVLSSNEQKASAGWHAEREQLYYVQVPEQQPVPVHDQIKYSYSAGYTYTLDHILHSCQKKWPVQWQAIFERLKAQNVYCFDPQSYLKPL